MTYINIHNRSPTSLIKPLISNNAVNHSLHKAVWMTIIVLPCFRWTLQSNNTLANRPNWLITCQTSTWHSVSDTISAHHAGGQKNIAIIMLVFYYDGGRSRVTSACIATGILFTRHTGRDVKPRRRKQNRRVNIGDCIQKVLRGQKCSLRDADELVNLWNLPKRSMRRFNAKKRKSPRCMIRHLNSRFSRVVK